MNAFRKYTSKKISTAGFTLIEIVVATFIMAVFTVLVLGVSSGVLRIWSSAAGRVESTRESRLVLSIMESDFDGIVYTSDGQILHYETENLGAGSFYPQEQAQLMMVTSTLDAPRRDYQGVERPGDICALRYELNYLSIFDDSSVNPEFSLYRGISDPLYTFDNFLTVNDLRTQWDTLIETSAPSSGGDANINTPVGNLLRYSAHSRRNIYASNIVDFTITFWARDVTTGDIYPMSSTNSGKDPLADVEFTDQEIYLLDGSLYVDDTISTDTLMYADLEFAFLSTEGADTLQRHIDPAIAEGIYNDLDEIIEEYGQRFTRRVGLNGVR